MNKMRQMIFVLGFLLLLTVNRVLAQDHSSTLSPSEAYKSALAPLYAARAQTNDLTDADKLALGIGVAHASRDCLALSANTSGFAKDAKELLALGQLCLFGQQYESARVTLVDYLALPEPPEKKLALVLLVRALLGMGEPNYAEPQVRSLLRDYPYDAQIHVAIDQIIDAAEGVNIPLDRMALQLCATQNAATLPLLSSGKALEGKDASVPSSGLFADAIRCAALSEQLNKDSNQGDLQKLAAIVQQPNWAGTADLAPMQAALERQQMVGERVPLPVLHGHLLGTNALVPRAVSLLHGTVLLLPFVLWSPSASDVISNLAKFASQQPVYAITSWTANTGRDDVLSAQILAELRLWQRTLPSHVSILIVPDTELSVFHIDSFPAGIVIRDGIVRSNSVLSSQGSERVLLRALADHVENLKGP